MSDSIDLGQLQAQLELNRSSLADSILSKLSASQAQPSASSSAVAATHAPRPAHLGVGAKLQSQTDTGRPGNLADARLRGALTAKRKSHEPQIKAAANSEDEDEEVGRAAAIVSRKKPRPTTTAAAKTNDPFGSTGVQAQKAAQASIPKFVTIDGETIDTSQMSKSQRKKLNRRMKESETKATSPPPPVPAKTPSVAKQASTSGSSLTPLQAQMMSKLSGSRFRTINEKLYTTHSREAMQMIDDSPSTFDEYHQGFREQVKSWPKNPLDRVAEMLDPETASAPVKAGKTKGKPQTSSWDSKFTGKPKARFSPAPLVVDFGAGEGGLAKKLVPKGLKVLSFDLLSTPDGWVKRQDSADVGGLPLPGYFDVDDPLSSSIAANSAPGIVDIAVFCLSLMGTNWVHMILEAKRVLRTGGELIIAEVSSRFDGFDAFVTLIQELGFGLEHQDASNTHFVLFEFVKLSPQSSNSRSTLDELDSKGKLLLKPCLYKRR